MVVTAIDGTLRFGIFWRPRAYTASGVASEGRRATLPDASTKIHHRRRYRRKRPAAVAVVLPVMAAFATQNGPLLGNRYLTRSNRCFEIDASLTLGVIVAISIYPADYVPLSPLRVGQAAGSAPGRPPKILPRSLEPVDYTRRSHILPSVCCWQEVTASTFDLPLALHLAYV